VEKPLFPTLTDEEFTYIRGSVAKLAEAWLTQPIDDDVECKVFRRRDRRIALRVQLDAIGIPHIGAVKNLGQLQCIVRFLAQNIAIN
jgi:hypothetical protein